MNPKLFKYQIRVDGKPWANYIAQERIRAERVFKQQKEAGHNVTWHILY